MIDFRSITHDHHLAKSITDEIRNMTEWLPEPFRISPYDEPFVGLTTSYIERIIDFENVSAVADDVVRAVQSFDTLRSVFGEWTQSPTMKMLGVNVPII